MSWFCILGTKAEVQSFDFNHTIPSPVMAPVPGKQQCEPEKILQAREAQPSLGECLGYVLGPRFPPHKHPISGNLI